MINHKHSASFVIAGAILLSACSPSAKAPDPAPTTTTTTTTVETAPAPTAAVPALFAGIAGLDRVPASLVSQMAADTAPHWARCGDDLVTQVIGADGKPQGFIIARGVNFTLVDAAIDVPSQQQGTTSRQGINLRSNSHIQYFGEGVSHTDISGRTVTNAGWGGEVRLTAPLPHWRADEVNGTWSAIFRPNTTDAAEYTARYRAADCTALPPTV
jgi:hypothetical protein